MTMNVQNTPGPWSVASCADGTLEIRAGTTRYPVAKIIVAQFPYRTKSDVEGARANARLIAAAPELLEAVKTVLFRFLTVKELSPQKDYQIISLLQAVIKGAEGE